MHKKGIAVEFLVRLIIAIVFLFGAVIIIKGFFRLSDEGLSSYKGLVDTIENTRKGELKSVMLDMDKETIILGFTKSANSITYPVIKSKAFWEMFVFWKWDFINPGSSTSEIINIKVNKPDTCSTSACICLCRDIKLDESNPPVGYGYTFTGICGKSYCYEIKGWDFVDYKDRLVNDLGFFKMDEEKIGGFAFYRTKETSRSRAMYVENYNGIIGVCMNQPCIPDEVKSPSPKSI